VLQFERSEPTTGNIRNFNSQLRRVLKRHNTVVESMAEAIVELKESVGVDIVNEQSIQYFLDRFYLNRISIRMLQNQHRECFYFLPDGARLNQKPFDIE
jgi:pyruvate dehydrogenase kinase 2/3/4